MSSQDRHGGKWQDRGGWTSWVTAILLSLLVLAVPSRAADEDGPLADFYSYLPAAPDLKLPEINIPFWTDDLKKARKAYRAGKYERAVKLFRRSSEDGNIVADWYLGHMYRTGRGVAKDDAVAYSYYGRVAEQFDPDEDDQNRLKIIVDATVRLADYQRAGVPGAGIKASPTMAARTYLKMATTYGHPSAQFALGVMNIRGEGMKSNPKQGLKWLLSAARKRHAPAEAYLGELYWDGKLVRRDSTRALMWYLLAKSSARPEENPEIYDRALQLEANVSEDERIEAEARASVWESQYPAAGVRPAANEP